MNYSNTQLRRFLRRYENAYPGADTRHVTLVFHNAFKCPRQRIAGNLRCMVHDQKTNRIEILIPMKKSLLYGK